MVTMMVKGKVKAQVMVKRGVNFNYQDKIGISRLSKRERISRKFKSDTCEVCRRVWVKTHLKRRRKRK